MNCFHFNSGDTRIISALTLWFVCTAAMAHGGVSIEDDLCVLQIGPYRMHFTGYQPLQSGSQEFCEDIPNVSTAIIVLDAVDEALRDMPLELRILRDVNNLGTNARVEELGDASAIEATTVARLPAAAHPTGSLTLQHPFTEAGRYIGYVKAQPTVGGEVVAIFPFAVGGGSKAVWIYALVLVAAVALAALLFGYAARGRRAAP